MNLNLRIIDKLFYGTVVLLVIVLGGLGSLIIKQRLNDIIQGTDRRVEMMTGYLEQMLPRPASRLDAKTIRQIIEGASTAELQAVEILDANNELTYVYERSGIEPTYDKKVERDLTMNNKRVGKMVVYFSVGQYIDSLRYRELLRLIVLISAAGLVFGVGLYFLVKRIVIRPIKMTMAFSEELAAGNYDKRMAVSSTDEMGVLQRSLNAMADAMQESVENLKASFYEAEGARREAIEASRLKSEFLASMSHEIRTPLNAIIGFSDILLEDEEEAEKKDELQTIKTSANILLENINDVLEFSKIEAGKLKLARTNVILADLVEEISPIIDIRLHGKDVRFDKKIDASLASPVCCDRMRLRQVMLNILINAAKFTRKGRISLEIIPSDGREAILFRVEDTGIGIPKDDRVRVFEPFIQANGTMTREYGGTGLGLAIAKRLVEMMGGEIWIEDKEDSGTVICFTLLISQNASNTGHGANG